MMHIGPRGVGVIIYWQEEELLLELTRENVLILLPKTKAVGFAKLHRKLVTLRENMTVIKIFVEVPS